ncbi:hypothetical protein KY289_018273 [Solanum tuberosum]|nr:hypothetical protein KY289_018273 [Solanum tuberosum]
MEIHHSHLSSASLVDDINEISQPNISGLQTEEISAKQKEVKSSADVVPRKRYNFLMIARIVRKEVVPDEERAKDTERVKDNWDGALSILEYGLLVFVILLNMVNE